MKDVRELWMEIKNPAQLADALERARTEEDERLKALLAEWRQECAEKDKTIERLTKGETDD